MAYATVQNLIDRYGQDQMLVLADRDNDGELDSAVMDRALADADAEVDAFLARRYQLPLAEVPDVLQRIACDIAVYRLCDNDAMVTDERRRRYEDAMSMLRRIGSGEVSLGITPQAAQRKAAAAFYEGRPRRFRRDR
ncbi:MAG: DUF1320 domain-containing protein [Proteobacteria bacterium]|nr:DUF1320 domain-containing protein [Pseudomonadota bacterium]